MGIVINHDVFKSGMNQAEVIIVRPELKIVIQI